MKDQLSGTILLFVICVTIFVGTMLVITLIGMLEHWLHDRHMRRLKRQHDEVLAKLRKL
jgi:hypothetical protein